MTKGGSPPVNSEVREFLKLLARITQRLTRESGRPDDGSKNGGRPCG